jgi:type II secretory pathway component GspD/PulD (secretin)
MKLIGPVLSGAGSIQGSSPPSAVATTGESISAGAGGGDTMALNDHIILLDYPENIKVAERLLKELDIRPKQVLVEATVLSCTLSEGMKLGVDLNFMAGLHLDGSTSTTEYSSGDSLQLVDTATTPMGQLGGDLITTGTPIETYGFAAVGGNGLRIGVTTGDMAAIITALETITDTTVLANPKILAVNKQLGQVYIGTKIGYVSETTIGTAGTVATQQVQFLDTGTKLSFRPYIGDDGYIRMDIHPKDSSGTLKANEIPDETSTELATNIIVKDGQTVVIGGLFRDVVVASRSQIPLLGDLPIVGAAFRGTSDTVTRQEVIVLLTPHIIEEPSDTKGLARAEDISRKRFGAKEELQWTGRARLAEDRYANAAKYYVDGDTEAALDELKYVLTLRPTYLEAIRLKERIISETDPNSFAGMERNVRRDVEKEDSDKWLKR